MLIEAFADEHERLFVEAQKTKNHGPVTSHYYSVMSKVIDEYFNGNFHFVPPLKENQTLEEALHSLHLRIGDELHLAPGTHCLDVGCGIGTVQIGNSNFKAAGTQNECKLVEADCKKMPFEDNTFDCAYAIYSLKYFIDLLPVLTEVARVLKPGGRFVIYDLVKTDQFDANSKEHSKVVSALEYACGMPPLHWRSEMIEKSAAVGLELIGSADLSKETGRPFHYSFSHSSSFMWMVNSNALARLIKIGQAIKLMPKGFHRFNKTFLAGTVSNIVRAGEMGVVSGAEILRVWNRTEDEHEKVLPLSDLLPEKLQDVDLVIEVAHPQVVENYAALILKHADLFIGSPTALADKQLYDSIQTVLREHSRRAVFIPAGAFWGSNDVKKMADLGTLRAMTITMIKHPSSFKVRGALVDLCEQALKENQPIVIFEGPVRLLCPLAPNNVNTMAGAAIAAHNLGFDHTFAKLIADPTLKEWHIVEYELKGENGFCIKLRRENPAKPGAVTGDSTYFAFLSSVIDVFH
ncbi:Methyltransferase [Aphelenchoides besseyi]|nr:Methyltransferase [Aphelenchoides besseyi]